MAPRGYDKYFLMLGVGTHPKLARLTDSEFRAHVVGVLAVAAMADPRGCLLVGDLPAGPVDIALAAGVPVRVATSAMRKLEAVGILQHNQEHGCLQVHDWDDVNPEPGSSTERMRRHRAANRDGKRHRSVTEASQTPSPEVEVEVEVNSEQAQRNARRRAPRKQTDQQTLPDSLPVALQPAAQTTLDLLAAVWAERGGLEPTLRGVGLAVAAFPDRDHLDVARSLEHWLTAGNGREADCGDIVQRYRRFLRSTAPAVPNRAASNVVPMVARRESPSDLLKAMFGGEPS